MADFNSYVPKLKILEGYGKYTNDPIDAGGATMSGVTLRTYRQFYGVDKDVEDLKAMSERQWLKIMKTGYWDKAGADLIKSQAVAEIIVDWTVNSGPAVLKKVQKIVGAEIDGVVGYYTLKAINSRDPRILFNEIKQARIDFYKRLAEANPAQKRFLQGWLNRINSFNYF